MVTKVYCASKLTHFKMWQELREKWREDSILICARWIDNVIFDEHATEDYLQGEWIKNVDDIASSEVIVTYATYDDHLRGALVEVGLSIGWNNPVLIVGYRSDVHGTHGSWQFHPNIFHVKDFDEAKDWILRYRAGEIRLEV